MIQPLIIVAKSQEGRAERLAKHCLELDGTELLLIPGGPGTLEGYPHCTTNALHQAAEEMRGKPFIWVETDSIPLKVGWVKAISEEYDRVGKEFMLSSDSNPPHDLVGGIGVYGPDTHWLIPKRFQQGAFDGWMVKHLAPLIHKTPLIQHSYGKYAQGKAAPHMFPRDAAMIRSDAVVFHRDRYQTLLGGNTYPLFVHAGDLGDIIAALPIIRQMGGGELRICNHRDWKKHGLRPTEGERYNAIKPLLDTVPFVHGVEFLDSDSGMDYNLIDWRTKYQSKRTLIESMSDYLGTGEIDTAPWLDVEADPRSKGKVIIGRSERYPNHSFPWHSVARKFKDRMIFLGTEKEYSVITRKVGKIPHIPTRDLLEVARLVKGSDMLVCNQTSIYWIGAALGVPIIQETNMRNPDSRLLRPNCQYIMGSTIHL